MDMGLRGKRALVAGASKGLGLAVARGLAAEGCRVAICARNEEALSRNAARMQEEFGVEVIHQALDLGQAGAAGEFVKETIQRLGGLEVLVTNNGGPPAGSFVDFSPADWQRAVEMNLLVSVDMARAALPALEAGQGSIVNLTSISVKQPIAGLMLSNSVRAAVIGWSKTLADELGPKGVRVNNACPGWILTERVDELLSHRAQTQGVTKEQALEAATAAIPMQRLGKPEELADLVVFLASARASYITGATFWVDGGLYRGMM